MNLWKKKRNHFLIFQKNFFSKGKLTINLKRLLENYLIPIMIDSGCEDNIDENVNSPKNGSTFSFKKIKQRMKHMNVNNKKIVEVVAALIWDKDKFLICQRPKDKARALLWEFVGGKVEKGETKEQALIRECKEELNITLKVGEMVMEVSHNYLEVTINLTLFKATIDKGVPEKLEHNDIKWITAKEIPNYEFCPADTEILKRIQMEKALDELLIELNMNPYERQVFSWVKESALLAINNPETWRDNLLENFGRRANVTRERARQRLEKAAWDNWTLKSKEVFIKRFKEPIKFNFEYSKPHFGEFVTLVSNCLREKYKID